MRLDDDLLAVAEAVIDDGLLAGRLGAAALEAAPVVDDLIEPVGAVVVRTRSVVGDGLVPRRGCLHVLPAVLELPGQCVAGILAVGTLAPADDPLIDPDPVELVGDTEALKSGGELGDRFRIFQGVQVEGAGLLVAGFLGGSAPAPAHRLHAELTAAEGGEGIVYFADPSR